MILAGAGSRRLDGADKPAVEIDGRTLLDHAIAAVKHAERVVVVGPHRNTERDVEWAEEQPPGGGPVAAIAAGLSKIRSAYCVVLASDLPAIAPAVPLLLTAAAKADVAVLTSTGRRNNLAAVWRTDALRTAIGRLDGAGGAANAAARALFAGLQVAEVSDDGDWGADCDTWADIEAARARKGGRRHE